MVYDEAPPLPKGQQGKWSAADWFRCMTANRPVVGGAGEGGGGGERKPEASLPLIPVAVPAVHACCNSSLLSADVHGVHCSAQLHPVTAVLCNAW